MKVNAKDIFKRIFDIARRGDATEQSYYSSLEELLKSYATSIGKKHIDIPLSLKKLMPGILISEYGMESSRLSATSKPKLQT